MTRISFTVDSISFSSGLSTLKAVPNRHMKRLTYLLIYLLLISCGQNEQNQKDSMKESNKIFAKKLIEQEFLKYADSSTIDNLAAKLKDSFDIYDDNNFKITHIDAEELAEFSFDFFMPNLNKILSKRLFNLSVKKANSDDISYDIVINQDTIQLYSQSELDNNLFWDIAPRNFFKKVNELLKVKNINEQFYLLYGGNDLHVLLLTDNQFSIISEYYKDDEKNKPYKP